MTGETKEVYVVRMRACGDSYIFGTTDVQGVLEIAKHQGECEIQINVNIGENPLQAKDYMV